MEAVSLILSWPFKNPMFNILFIGLFIYIVFSFFQSIHSIFYNRRLIKQYDKELEVLNKSVEEKKQKIKEILRQVNK